ncbi:TetR/AcrR family transcriptional regulator [Thermocrispum municipale]|uniref:TetR/AcrR family transcriptional regulator n=1 Tax=Thermocrispum municipale TaxID=37926 RepID=UPI00048F57D6|nr:TetR/AcrR family transcriptional regulator [Thermocrispum municipale]
MARKVDPGRVARMRERILAEAAEVFAMRGFEGASVADVARAAEVSPATVFYYFGDKATLFRSLFEQDIPKAEALVARYADADDAVRAIVDVVESLAKDATDPRAPALLIELLRRTGRDPELLDVVRRSASVIHEGLTTLIERGLESGQIDASLDARETASWLQSVVDAAYLNARPGHCPAPALRRTVLRYLAPENRGGP